MRPDREVSGAAGKDRVGRQAPAEERQHLGEIEVAGQRPRLEVREVVGARRLGPATPARGVDGQQPPQPGRELGQVGDDGQVGLVDASQLARVGMDVHEGLARPRHVEQRVAAGRYVPELPSDRDEQIGSLHPARERRIHADRQWTGVRARAVVDVVLAAKGRDDRDRVRLAEEDRVLAGLRRPATLAHDDERSLGRRQQLPQATQLLVPGSRSWDLRRRGVGGVRLLVEHVLGQRQHDRPRPSCRRDGERARRAPGSATRRPPEPPTWRASRRQRGSRAPGTHHGRHDREAPGRRRGSAASSPGRRCARRRTRGSRPGRA